MRRQPRLPTQALVNAVTPCLLRSLLPRAYRCAQPGQQQGRRFPSFSSERALSMWLVLVSGFLTEVVQQIHSLRARGVRLFHFSSASGSDANALRRSVGTSWTTPVAISSRLFAIVPSLRRRRSLVPFHGPSPSSQGRRSVFRRLSAAPAETIDSCSPRRIARRPRQVVQIERWFDHPVERYGDPTEISSETPGWPLARRAPFRCAMTHGAAVQRSGPSAHDTVRFPEQAGRVLWYCGVSRLIWCSPRDLFPGPPPYSPVSFPLLPGCPGAPC